MITPTSSPAAINPTAGLTDAARRTALVTVTTLFFMWGFLTCLNDILVPHLKSVFTLNYVQASLIQLTFFGAYFIMSLPAGLVIAAVGYKRGMVIGLLVSGLGAFLFYPAAAWLSYGMFLAALFTLATGITVLQVAANPYISALGKPETASSRLNLAQAFNSFGTTIAPWIGGWLILSNLPTGSVDKLTEAASVKIPYLGLGGALLLLALIIGLIHLPKLSAVEEEKTGAGFGHELGRIGEALRIPHLSLGAICIFVYVGAEVAIGSYLINYLEDPKIAGLAPQLAAHYVSYYWGGAMIGRFIGSALLQKIRPNVLLALFALIATLLCATGFLTDGFIAMWAVLLIGFFNSIMFPNIFTLGIDRLEHLTSQGSSILIMAIVGGAIIPVLMGKMADLFGVHHSLFIPAICYLYIIYYGLAGYRKGLR